MDTHMKSCYTEVCEVALRNSSEKGKALSKDTNQSEQQQESTATNQTPPYSFL